MLGPPVVPQDITYTSHWCEENIYQLVAYFSSREEITSSWEISAVFISNKTKTVALWSQKLGDRGKGLVVWDYHVVMILTSRQSVQSATRTDDADHPEARSWVYDFDTRLPIPCILSEYINQTFSNQRDIASRYQSLFRVIKAQAYLDNFASDRTHMLRPSLGDQGVAVYTAPPPPYPPICGRKAKERCITNNLMSDFVSMEKSDEVHGMILDFESFLSWILRGD